MKESTYVKFLLRSSKSEKDRVRSIYEEIKKHEEKEAKNREKYDKAKEELLALQQQFSPAPVAAVWFDQRQSLRRVAGIV